MASVEGKFIAAAWWIVACFAASTVLVVLFLMALPVGPDVANLEDPSSPQELARLLQEQAPLVTRLELIDFPFIALYTAVFWGLFRGMREHWAARPAIALGFIAALFDVGENAHLLWVLGQVESGVPVSAAQVTLVRALDMLKFSFAAAAVLLFALALWPRSVPLRVLAGVGFLFSLVTGLSLLGIGGAATDLGKIVLMLLVLLVAGSVGVYLRWRAT